MDNAYYVLEKGFYLLTSPSGSMMVWVLLLRYQWSLMMPDGTTLFCQDGVKQGFHRHLNLKLTLLLMKTVSWHDAHKQGGHHPVTFHQHTAP
jgi:hypothetical protein